MDWVQRIIDSLAEGKRYKSLLQKCIGNMGNKKLYKYYCFESEHTVENITNDILYMQNPVEFNDPLDCNIGMSADSVFELFVPMLLSKAGLNLNDREYDFIKCLLTNKERILLRPKDDLLQKCLNNPAFSAIYSSVSAGKDVEDKEIVRLVMEQPELLAIMLRNYLDRESGENGAVSYTDDEIINCICNSPSILRNLLPSIVPEDEKTRKIISVFTKDEGMLEKIKELAIMTDQPEVVKKLDELDGMFSNGCASFHQELGRIIGVSCFSRKPDEMLMWSHYANKHTGICVEYDFGKLFSNERYAMLFPINYSVDRPLLPLKLLLDFRDGELVFDENKLSLVAPYFISALIAKADVWKYEEEWRLIKVVKDNNRLVQLPLISRIITGCKISEENFEIAKNLARNKSVPLSRCCLMSDKYKIKICNLN